MLLWPHQVTVELPQERDSSPESGVELPGRRCGSMDKTLLGGQEAWRPGDMDSSPEDFFDQFFLVKVSFLCFVLNYN